MSHIRGRFNKPPDKLVVEYTSSLPFDCHLWPYDIQGSLAHAKMLARQGIITDGDASSIEKGLNTIGKEITEGAFKFKPEMEDVHMVIEGRLFEIIGEAAGKLHTARSRNDQVALDLRLFVKEASNETAALIKELQQVLIKQAEANEAIIMPGYTHLQPAQPVLLAHHLLAYFEMLGRDIKRFKNCHKEADVLPLGSGALAGTSFNIDRQFLANELGFVSISSNSMDAVSDRDFVLSFLSAASICMMHLSRLAEEIILWSSAEFGFVELDDAYATGSSIMPQKKNPDVAELARGKTGRIYGNLIALLTTLKALPLTYNRDLQEDKESLFDSVDTLQLTLKVFCGLMETLSFRADKMSRSIEGGYILATDLADYLVRKGESFRSAHSITGKLVNYAVKKGKSLKELTLEEYRDFSPAFDQDVFQISLKTSVAARNNTGGTAHNQVAEALRAARNKLAGE